MSESVGKQLPKPQMRGMLIASIRRNLIAASIAAVASGIAFKLLISDPRKRAYAEYRKNYNEEAEYKRMRDKGLFQSAS